MRVLVIGDIHEPVSHPGYLAFCKDLRAKHRCDQVMFIGDVVDWHAVSFHAHHPEAPGPKDEYELAKVGVSKWCRTFPRARVCIGNHDERLIRLCETVNIPKQFLRDYKEIWGTPNWEWDTEFVLDDVYYFHGTGSGGIHPAYCTMQKMLMSVVMGHIHSAGGIKWRANPVRRVFGMDTGCGIDDKAVAFAYGHHLKVRSILSACVVLDGTPIHEIMPCGPGEKYHRSNFGLKPFGGFIHEVPNVHASDLGCAGPADNGHERVPVRRRNSRPKTKPSGLGKGKSRRRSGNGKR